MANRHVYIGSAWPYVNGSLHMGHIAALLPADLLARYHRLAGDSVLWTSGSDCHGTPITERARKEGKTAREVAEFYHKDCLASFNGLGFSYSLYWATMEPNHYERVQKSFLDLWEKGLIVEDSFKRAKCATCNDYRADREINGTCFICMHPAARGDQCDNCGEELNPDQLIDPMCAVCSRSISFEESRELFFDLPALADRLKAWVSKQTHWRDNAKKWTQGWLDKGLKRRPISRDIDWGIPVPLKGWENRRIYVWFEAVHGYLTASMEWAAQQGDPDAWKPFWTADDPNVRHYYVIGKDNIPFHTLMWPGILLGRGRLALPWHIVSSEFLGLEGKKLSTSQNWALWVPDFLSRYSADFLRYYLITDGPEQRDTDFTWKAFVDRTNAEVVNNYGNLVSRVLMFVAARFDHKVPEPGPLDAVDMGSLPRTFLEVAEAIERTEFRRAIECIMAFVREANQYLNAHEPWNEIKTDVALARTTTWVVLQTVAALAILTEPFMPFQAERLRTMLNLEHRLWSVPRLEAGHTIGDVRHLFERLDPKIVDEELERLQAQSTTK